MLTSLFNYFNFNFILLPAANSIIIIIIIYVSHLLIEDNHGTSRLTRSWHRQNKDALGQRWE